MKYSKNIGLITVAIFIIYMIWDKIISFLSGTPLKRLNTIGATLDDAIIKNMSNKLYIAMNSYGTDEDAIYSTLKDISTPNFNKLFNEFGKKYYDQSLGINGNVVLDFKLDLFGWLNAELNESELSHLKSIAPNIFI
jgi:hypothetical protein